MAAERKTKLSKNLLRMKFMQRGLDSETKKQLEEEEKKMISEEHWYLDLPELKEKECFIIEEQSFLLCEDLLYGRMSFRGFNPEVEKLMLQMNAKNKTEEVEDETVELDVSDEEMARRYETLVGTVGKKFAKKRDRANYEEDENGHVKPTVKKCLPGCILQDVEDSKARGKSKFLVVSLSFRTPNLLALPGILPESVHPKSVHPLPDEFLFKI
uniref:M-phase phosphoprotein 6 n=1 Tax=Suricata suricatta TaxID=37032 RepID=A0A673VKY1_SURSU